MIQLLRSWLLCHLQSDQSHLTDNNFLLQCNERWIYLIKVDWGRTATGPVVMNHSRLYWKFRMILTNVISGNSPTFSIGLGPGAGGGGTGGGLGQDGVKSAVRICKLCTWCGLVLGGDRRLTDRGRMKGKVWSEMTSSSARGSLVAVVWWAEDGAGHGAQSLVSSSVLAETRVGAQHTAASSLTLWNSWLWAQHVSCINSSGNASWVII